MDTKDNFETQIRKFTEISRKIEDRKFAETGTRKYVIDLFIDALGYDSSNPDQVLVENADSDSDDNVRVDYTIMHEGKYGIIVEAKAITRNLNNKEFRKQLSGYFRTYHKAQIAILTNGKYVKFYSHLDVIRDYSLEMDKEPFFEFNLQDIKETDIEALKFFRRENFSPEKAVEAAMLLKYSKEVKEYLESQLNNPSEKFISLITSERKSIDDMVKNKEKKNNHKKQLIIDAIKFAATEITGKKIVNENASQPSNKHATKESKVRQENKIKDGNFSAMSERPRKYMKRSLIKEIYEQYRKAIKNLGENIEYEIQKQYIVFRINNKVIASIIPEAESILIALNVKNISDINDPRNICIDTTGKKRHGSGNLRVRAKVMNDFDYIIGLIKQVYEQKS